MDYDGGTGTCVRCSCQRKNIVNDDMNRIFNFTGHRFKVLHWEGKKFTGMCSFEPDKEGYLKFEQYLNSTANLRTKLLVDVIEEDFRIEPIPHVYGKDKQAVIGRTLDRYYRSSLHYTYSETLWRQKTGRKDDDVMLGAITNPKLLEIWLEIIEKCGTPLSGIWTLPLVSKDVLSLIKTKSDAVLLVSQQVNSNLRQSFFKNKKLISSRTSVINQDDDQISQLAEHAEPEIARTISFLRIQGHIKKDEDVEVHILAPEDQVISLEEKLISDDHLQHTIHAISSIEDASGLSGLDGRLSDGLFAWLCLTKFKTRGHYGEAKEFRQFYYSLAASALYAASIITLLFGVLVTEANIGGAMKSTRLTELYARQEAEIKQIYDSKFKAFESILADAKIMNASVDLANQIKNGRKVSPLDFFIELSHILKDPEIGDVSIDNISWSTEQLVTSKQKNEPEAVSTNLALDYPVQHVAMVKGRIPVSTDDYAASVERINTIVDVLKNNSRVKSVKILKMPVEVRPDKKISVDSGIKSIKDGEAIKQGAFSLEIRMKAYGDV